MGTVFDGLRVLDLSRAVAGEYCTKLFGDLGATVTKVERPGEGSLTRHAGPFPGDVADHERSALFLHLNTNKRSVVLDLASPEGSDVVKQLARDADLLVESFRPGTMERFGIGWSALREANPGLVMTRITNFGQTGPYRDREASLLTLQSLGGPMYSTGMAGRAPLQKPGNLPGYVVGRSAAAASLAALLGVRAGGPGAMVDVSAHEVLLTGADRRGAYLLAAEYGGLDAPRGVRSPHRPIGFSPVGPFPCRDGHVMLYVTEPFIGRMASFLGDQELTALFADPEAVRHDPEGAKARMLAVLLPWLADHRKDEIMEAAEGMRLPVTAIYSVGEVLAAPHFDQRGTFVEAHHERAGLLKYVGAPWRMRGRWAIDRTAPLLGQDQEEVLSSIRPRSSGDDQRSKRAPISAVSRHVGRIRPSRESTADALPLRGIRVVDLTVVWSGPGATMLLGDLGAEVIRVESVARASRGVGASVPPPPPGPLRYERAVFVEGDPAPRPYNRSASFNWHARNKLSVTLPSLDTDEGRALLLELVAASDVVVENNAPTTLPKLGLDYQTLREVNPEVVVVRMPALGLSGPMRDYIGYGPNFNALAGIAAMDGYEGEDPSTAGENYHMDESAPAGVAFAVMAALWERGRSGHGQLIEFSQTENTLAEVGEWVLDYQVNGRNPATWGNGHPTVVQDVTATAGEDRWVAYSIRGDGEWRRLVETLGEQLAEWADLDARDRHRMRDDIRHRLAGWAVTRPPEEVVAVLAEAGVPAAEVMAERQVLEDPHLVARQWFQRRSHPEVGEHRYPGHAWKIEGRQLQWGRPFPALGEDNEYVLCDVLGMSSEDYQKLVEEGVVGTRQLR